MKRYNRQKNIIIMFFSLWFLFSLTIGHKFVRSQNSFFPFYSWRLFDHVVFEMHDFGIEILALDGQTLDPPLDFIDDLVPRSLKLVRLFSQPDRIVQRLGMAKRGYDYSNFSQVREAFEKNYLHKYNSGSYRLVRRVWDPLEAWQKKKKGDWLKEREVIAVLDFNKQEISDENN